MGQFIEQNMKKSAYVFSLEFGTTAFIAHVVEYS